MRARPARSGEGHLLSQMFHGWHPEMAGSYYGRDIEGDLDAWFVVEMDGAVVGFLEQGVFCTWGEQAGYEHLTVDDLAPFIRWIFVLPQHRDRGAGTILLNGWLDSLESSGVPLAVVTPDKSTEDEARVRFFERHGFGWLTTNEDWLPPWLMGRPLPSR